MNLDVAMSRLLDRLRSGKILLMDGAMGTELARRGAHLGEECLELWNLTRPDDVRAVHRAYLDAGAECLLTNTFQANPTALAKHGLQSRTVDFWQAALQLAREAAGRTVFVVADIGSLFYHEWPVLDVCRDADGLLLETWSDVPLLLSAAAQVHFHAKHRSKPQYRPPPPLLVSFTYHRPDGVGPLRTFRHYEPESCAQAAVRCSAKALGVNCGADIDMDDLLEIVQRYRAITDLPLFVRANAGTPDASGRYPRSPEAMAAKLPALLAAGVTMIGGCCGTTPAHIAAFRQRIDAWQASPL
jgi:5-methyltetrahydrofolate--homocysteine methyltransferase